MYLHASIITNSLSTKLCRYRIKESIQSTLKVSKKNDSSTDKNETNLISDLVYKNPKATKNIRPISL